MRVVPNPTLWAQLTPAERKIAFALWLYPSHKTVARHLGVAPETIRAQVLTMHHKLNVHDRVEMLTLLYDIVPVSHEVEIKDRAWWALYDRECDKILRAQRLRYGERRTRYEAHGIRGSAT